MAQTCDCGNQSRLLVKPKVFKPLVDCYRDRGYSRSTSRYSYCFADDCVLAVSKVSGPEGFKNKLRGIQCCCLLIRILINSFVSVSPIANALGKYPIDLCVLTCGIESCALHLSA